LIFFSQIREYATPERPTIYQLPIHDECAPDLYLPVMSFITYVLLSAMCYGSAGEFSPEVIPDVASKCAVYQTIEVLIFRGGFYSMQVPISFLDLFSYTGYKYVGLCMNMIAGIIVGTFGWFGTRGYYICFLWTATAAAYFMLKTMSNNIPMQTSPVGPKREIMVLAFGALQYLTMWLVSQTKAFDDVIKKGKPI
jgi:protein transport protein YIF1